MSDIFARAVELDEGGRAYALATVVAVDRPVSAKPGDRAIVTSSGRVEGWVGGSCSEPIVVREAIAALADGHSRLIRIRPPEAPREPPRHGVVTEITTCASEGGLDVFVEPRHPRPRLVVTGSSPIARTLAKLASIFGYRMTAVTDDPAEHVPGAGSEAGIDALERMELGPQDAVVVATMNRYDETALEAALSTGAGYIGLVASRSRAEDVTALLQSRGVDETALARVTSPAGLDLGPSSQEEIALAIMAEVVAVRHQRESEGVEKPVMPPEETATEAVDPVCGMKVAIVPAAITAQHGGETFYFCNPGCREEFLQHPDRYTQVAGER